MFSDICLQSYGGYVQDTDMAVGQVQSRLTKFISSDLCVKLCPERPEYS
jgi:hypothetical protein